MTKRTRVVIAQKYLAPYRVNLFNEINNLENIDLTVLCYGRIEKRRKWKEFPPFDFLQIDIPVLSIPIKYDKNLEFPWFFVPKVLFSRPDVVICTPDLAGMFFLIFSKLAGFKIIGWTETTPVKEQFISAAKESFRRVFFRNSNAVIAASKQTVKYLEKFNVGEKIYLAHNSIDAGRFEIAEPEASEKFANLRDIKFLYSGNLLPVKGVDVLVDVFNRMSKLTFKYEYTLDILGAGELTAENIPHVSSRGFKEGTEYSDYFKKSHIFVMPSRADANPITIIEALKSGNVILCTNGVGSFEDFVDGNGIVVERGSPDALLEGVKTLLSLSPVQLLKMSLRSIEIAKEISHLKSAGIFSKAIVF